MLKLDGREALKGKMFEISCKPPLEGACGAWLHPPAGLQHPDCTSEHPRGSHSHSPTPLAV